MDENFSGVFDGFGWNYGDTVIVQVPTDTGFSTFNGIVSGVSEDGQIEVYRDGRGGTVLCRPEWVYPDDCWQQ